MVQNVLYWTLKIISIFLSTSKRLHKYIFHFSIVSLIPLQLFSFQKTPQRLSVFVFAYLKCPPPGVCVHSLLLFRTFSNKITFIIKASSLFRDQSPVQLQGNILLDLGVRFRAAASNSLGCSCWRVTVCNSKQQKIDTFSIAV